MVSHICKAIDLDIESASMAEFKASTREALKRLRDTASSETREEVRSGSRTASLRTSESEIMEDSTEQNEGFEDAPLIALFKDAMFLQTNNTTQANGRPLGRYVDQRIKACVEALMALLPRNEDLRAILKTTQKYWNIWPIPPSRLVTCKGNPPVTDVASAQTFIFDALKSGIPTRTIKAILWLALCIQQLSTNFIRQRPLPTSQSSLIDSYMSGADTLLSMDEESGGSLEGLECLELRAKLYINMGKPRKAWLCVRHAMNMAMQLGLHRLDKPSGERQQRTWDHIWQQDRQLSLILGFPNGITDANILARRESESVYAATPHNQLANIAHGLAIAAGHINDRNQSHVPVADYSVTEQIERELKQCRAAIPPEWWDDSTAPLPLHEIYTREVVKASYHQLYKFLHLPHLLQPPSSSLNPQPNPDPRHEEGRQSALSACRSLVQSYHRLRTLTSPEVIMCDLLDFQVFGCAAVLVLDLLLSPSSSSSCLYQEAQDWGLIEGVTRGFRDKAALMECRVAGQAARLLEDLSMAHRGAYAGVEGYEAVIPYFGRVVIGKMKMRNVSNQDQNQNSQIPLSSSSDLQTAVGNVTQQPQFSNTVAFSANTFMPFGQETMAGCFYPDMELGVDWTSVFDVDRSYEWNQAPEAFGYSV